MKFVGALALLTVVALSVASASFAGDEKSAPAAGPDAATAAPATAAANPATGAAKDVATAAPSTSTAPSSSSSAADAVVAAPSTPSPKRAAGDDDEQPSAENPRFLPMPAWDGNPGMFTLETGELLPRGGFNFTAGSNKISRMPGSITVLQTGPALAVGVSRWFSLFVLVNADEHIHVDQPSNLSLNLPPLPLSELQLQFQNTIYQSLIPVPGFRPAYVEDYPFASVNGGGVGEVDLGFKIGLLSERRGNRLGLSIRNDFFIPTKRGFANLLDDEVQSGQFNYGIGVQASKHIIHRSIFATVNWGYRFSRMSTFQVATAAGTQAEILKQSDQMTVGVGLLMFPDKRINVISEYNGLIYVRNGIPDMTCNINGLKCLGARDPVDSTTGFRLYLWRGAAIDVGYRYSLSLSQHTDRNGFIAKLDISHWPARPEHVVRGAATLTATCSVDVASVSAGGVVQATVNATDSLGYPLTYTWIATAGRIDGTGPFARWDSSGVSPGSYTITVRVDDGAGKTASCSQPVTVR